MHINVVPEDVHELSERVQIALHNSNEMCLSSTSGLSISLPNEDLS